MKIPIWSIDDIKKVILNRRENKLDSCIAVTGLRGKGKSTFIAKLLFRFDNEFDPERNQHYNRREVIDDIVNKKEFIIWDDEAVTSAYKRNFQNTDQKDLIQQVTISRKNLNLYIATLPDFLSLDKDLRDLFFMHIHIIWRPTLKELKENPNLKGIAFVSLPSEEMIYSKDKWELESQIKLEKWWQSEKKRNPTLKYPYHKISTIVGFVRFGDLTPKQREKIECVKEEKAKEEYNKKTNPKKSKTLMEGLFEQLRNGGLTDEGLQAILNNYNLNQPDNKKKKISSVKITLNRMLKDSGDNNTTKYYFDLAKNQDKIQSKKEFEDLFS